MEFFMKWIALLLLATTPVFGQVSTDEAQKRLDEKQAAKVAAREKVVSIKQGDLDDLRSQILALQKQISELRGQLTKANGVPAAPGAAFPDRPQNPKIELKKGMTFEEVRKALGRTAMFSTGEAVLVDTNGTKTYRWALDQGHEVNGVVGIHGYEMMREINARFNSNGILDVFEDRQFQGYTSWDGSPTTTK